MVLLFQASTVDAPSCEDSLQTPCPLPCMASPRRGGKDGHLSSLVSQVLMQPGRPGPPYFFLAFSAAAARASANLGCPLA